MPTSRRCDQRDYGEHVKMAACLSADHEPIQRMSVQVIFSRPNHPWSPSAPATPTSMKVITVRQAVLDIWNDFTIPSKASTSCTSTSKAS